MASNNVSVELQPLVQPFDIQDGDGPPPYSAADPSWRITYVDFTPKCLVEGGIVTSAKFETFDMLVARANDYLQRHPAVCVKSMETTQFVVYDTRKTGTIVDTRMATLKDTRTSGGVLLKALRLWIMPKATTTAEQVGYLNVIPACLDPGGIITRPKFDTLSNTVRKLNKLLHKKPLPGRIINIETVEQHFRQYSTWLQPDRCHWTLQSDLSITYISFIRIYYEAGPHSIVNIAFKDITPAMARTKRHNLPVSSQFETVQDLLNKAHQWINTKDDLKVLNIETNYHKIKKANVKRLNTDSALITHFSMPDLIQSLRIWYTTENMPNPVHYHISEQAQYQASGTEGPLCYKMFWPIQLREGGMLNSPLFENMIDTRQRLKDWALNNNDLKVVSCETVHIKFDQSCPYDEHTINSTFHSGSFGYSSTWITTLRLCILSQTTSL